MRMRTTNTTAKPIHSELMAELIPQAAVSNPNTTPNTPNTAPAAIAAAPRARLLALIRTSARASSSSSRTSTLIRSETSVTVVPSVSGFPFSAGNAFQDQRDEEAAGERRADYQLGAVGPRRLAWPVGRGLRR